MKAIVLRRYGSPDVLRLEEIAEPPVGDDQVRVKVRATAVNDWDWAMVRGKPYIYRLLFGLRRPKVRVLGAEVAGVVEAVGSSVTKFRPGDAVYGDISDAGFGGFAEYVSVQQDALSPMPAGMTFEQAAALPHAAGLALQGLMEVGQIRSGESVLINGAGGGVGTLGVQIAKQFGATVTGVDGAAKLGMLRSIGFDDVIDFRAEDFTRRGKRYDLILDTKTNRSPWSYLRCLNPGGRYVTVGGDVSGLLQIGCLGLAFRRPRGKQLRIVMLKPNQGLDVLNELFAKNQLRWVIDGPYPLSEAPQALRRFGDAEHLGKIVISVSA